MTMPPNLPIVGGVINASAPEPHNPGQPLTAATVFPLIPKLVDGAAVRRGR